MAEDEVWTALVRRAQTGDVEAFTVLVGRFQNMAYGYAFAILNDFPLAEDATQEAFIEMYRVLPTLREVLAFPVWLKRIVYKHCNRLTRRKQPRIVPIDDHLQIPSQYLCPSEAVERREFERRIRSAVANLPLTQRTATTLYYMGGYSYQEISAFLGVPVQTVKSRLHDARGKLKSAMLDLVVEEMKMNALPQDFTRRTVEQAVQESRSLNQQQKFGQAEEILKDILKDYPQHAAALCEYNRALMRGRVYGEGRWDLLPELVERGRVILLSVDDEEIRRQVANTLCAVPAMPEAIEFIEGWIASQGDNLERTGMLAWARGCVADYQGAQADWDRIFELALGASSVEILHHMPFVAYTLADCLHAAGEIQAARDVVDSAWKACGALGPVPSGSDFGGDSGWLMLYRMVGFDLNQIYPILLERNHNDPGVQLCLQAWAGDVPALLHEWSDWAKERFLDQDFPAVETCRFPVLRGLRSRGEWQSANLLAQSTWKLAETLNCQEVILAWDWERFNPIGAIQNGDFLAAKQLAEIEMSERGVRNGAPWAITVASALGVPTPELLVQAVDAGGVEAVDEYGMFGSYLLAREAAARGDTDQAFDALRKSLSYWTNAPFFYMNFWEIDARWGSLRDDPEFKHAFADKHSQIGPVYGTLHYFPGW